jgi:hypothetical protein
MLSVVLVSVVILNVVLLIVAMLNVILLSVIMQNVILLSVVMLKFILLIVAMLNVILLSVIMQNVILLSVVMLNVVMLSAVGLKLWHHASFFRSLQYAIFEMLDIRELFMSLCIFCNFCDARRPYYASTCGGTLLSNFLHNTIIGVVTMKGNFCNNAKPCNFIAMCNLCKTQTQINITITIKCHSAVF